MDNEKRIEHIKEVISRIEDGMTTIVKVPLLFEDNTVEGRALIESLRSQKYCVGPTPVALFMCNTAQGLLLVYR